MPPCSKTSGSCLLYPHVDMMIFADVPTTSVVFAISRPNLSYWQKRRKENLWPAACMTTLAELGQDTVCRKPKRASEKKEQGAFQEGDGDPHFWCKSRKMQSVQFRIETLFQLQPLNQQSDIAHSARFQYEAVRRQCQVSKEG